MYVMPFFWFPSLHNATQHISTLQYSCRRFPSYLCMRQHGVPRAYSLPQRTSQLAFLHKIQPIQNPLNMDDLGYPYVGEISNCVPYGNWQKLINSQPGAVQSSPFASLDASSPRAPRLPVPFASGSARSPWNFEARMQQPWPTHGGFLSHGGSRVAPNHARLQHFSTETSFGDPPFQETPKWRAKKLRDVQGHGEDWRSTETGDAINTHNIRERDISFHDIVSW